VRVYERLKDNGSNLTSGDESNYRLDMQQLEYLMVERNKMLGLN
jgi:hypothetical protein